MLDVLSLLVHFLRFLTLTSNNLELLNTEMLPTLTANWSLQGAVSGGYNSALCHCKGQGAVSILQHTAPAGRRLCLTVPVHNIALKFAARQ